MPDHAEDLAIDIGHDLQYEHGCYSIEEVASRIEDMEEFMKEYFDED